MNLSSNMALDLYHVLKDTYCHELFNNFFNSLTLIQKLQDNGLYGLGTSRSDRINMLQMKYIQRNKVRRSTMQTLQPHSLYQMVWQASDATRKPFGRNNIYIDCAKKIEGFCI